jgi:hypothetical protein
MLQRLKELYLKYFCTNGEVFVGDDYCIDIPDSSDDYTKFLQTTRNICSKLNVQNPFDLTDDKLIEESIVATIIARIINDICCIDYEIVCPSIEWFINQQNQRKENCLKPGTMHKHLLLVHKFMDFINDGGVKFLICYIIGCDESALYDVNFLHPSWIKRYANSSMMNKY